MRLTFALASLALLATPALAADEASEAKRLEQMLAGRTAGPPQSCVSGSLLQQSRTFAGKTIVYRSKGATLYRNDFPGGCPGLRQGRAIVTRSATGTYCRGDIVDVVDFRIGIPLTSCSLGDFVPYRRTRKADQPR
jgi:hypothetical protein